LEEELDKMEEAMDGIDEGMGVSRDLVKDVDFANVQAMVACSQNGLYTSSSWAAY